MNFYSILLYIVIFSGLWMLFTGLLPKVSPKAEKAVNSRAGKKESISVMFVGRIAAKLARFIQMEEMKRQKLQRSLMVLGRSENAELLEAKAWATGLLYAVSVLILSPVLAMFFAVIPIGLSPKSIFQMAIVLAAALLFVGRNALLSELEKDIQKRREAIEWELPQFSGTVLQCLGHTRNVIDILESYKKICSPTLELEIERTLNDMRTGNQEQAIRNMALRVNSGSFSQLTQGLIGLLRGDDQRNYFEFITNDFTSAQQEAMKREILKRPSKLTINNVFLLVGMMAMFVTAIAGYLMDTSRGVFF